MTAEIALMNRSGIALAADSAVTISGPSGQKIYNTVNKLFMLSKYFPVAVMVSGNAMVTGLPWETIVKAFRRDLGHTSFPHLSDYGNALLRFTEDNPRIFSEELEEETLRATTLSMFAHLLDVMSRRLHERFEADGKVSRNQVQALMRGVIKEHLDDYEAQEDLPDHPPDFASQVAKRYGKVIETAVQVVFDQMPLSQLMRKSLTTLACLQFQKAAFTEPTSGVVVAGFGEDDFFPSLIEYEFVGVLLGKAKYRVAGNVRVCTTSDGFVIPFAQREMVNLFMEGIDPYYRMVFGTALERFLDGFPDAIVESIPLSVQQRKTASRQMRVAAKELLRRFNDTLDDYAKEYHVNPIVSSVASLPKEELASMAEALVNLTSFKRRVTMDPETVGGPVDVAVLSKGDGFIWIKRKHYFESNLNPHFLRNVEYR